MNKLRTHEHMCTPCSDCVADMYGDVKNTCGMYTSACIGVQDNYLVHITLTAKRTHTRASTPARQCRNLFAMQTITTHSALELYPRNCQNPRRPWRSRSCVSTHASSDHSPWCGPHPVCLTCALALWPRNHPAQNYVCTISRFFFLVVHHPKISNIKRITGSRTRSNTVQRVVTLLVITVWQTK